MTFEHNERERQLIETAVNFGERHVQPAAAQWERDRTVPLETLRAATAVGLTAIEVPEGFGGQGCRYSVKMRIGEEISKSCMAFAFSLINTQNVAAKLARECEAEVARDYVADLVAARIFGATALSEPGVGSDFANIAMSANRVSDGWVLNGEKAWITNAAIADIFIVYAQTDATKGWRGIASFLVDGRRDGFIRQPPFELFGGHAIGTGGFVLQNYIVPDRHLLAGPGAAFKRAMGSINGARTYVAAMCCGMTEAALTTARDYGQARTSFGRPLLANQGLRWVLADVATELEAARLLTYRAAQLVDEGDDGAILAAAHAKKFAARMAQRLIPECIQLMGANGLREEYGLGRHLACAKIAHYVDGSTEIQNERIAAVLFGSAAR